MELVLRSAMNAIEDLRAPGMLKLFFGCIGLTFFSALLVLGLGATLVEVYLVPVLPTEHDVSSGFLAGFFKFMLWATVIGAFLVPIFLLFWTLMIFIASFFDEYIAEIIEKFRYPQLAMGKSHPFWTEFRQDIYFSLQIFLANAILIIIPIFWPFWAILFPLMNGYMLGRYFFRMAGGRHIGRKAADALAKKHRGKVLLAGLLMVIASGIPLLQLLVPFWGVAMMVHLYHLLDNPAPQEVIPPTPSTSQGDI